jgi:hypothetical protein
VLLLKPGPPSLEETYLIGITLAPFVALAFFIWLWQKQKTEREQGDYVERQDDLQRSSQ